MIQKVAISRISGGPAGVIRHPTSDTTESWSTTYNHKKYTLEVVQDPLRARMCGFGDKDRRPLAPAAVAKMTVHHEDDTPVDVDDVDCSFFLVTVDLWSADAKHEMNLVLHPTSADRYVPSSAPKAKKRANTGSAAPSGSRSERQSTPVTATPTPSSSQYPPPTTAIQSPYVSQGTPYAPGYPYPPPESGGFQAMTPYPTADGQSPWAYAQPGAPPMDRPQHPGDPSAPPGAYGAPQPGPWGQPPYAPAVENPGAPGSNGSWVNPAESYPQDGRYPQEPYAQVPTANPAPPPPVPLPTQQPPTPAQVDTSMYASASYAQQQHQQQTQAQFSGGFGQQEETPSSTLPPLPRHTYTRTLVGPLSANACRLLDEHRKPGIFFLFQDLSIRTEGTFRLRLRLMNVGAPPAPEPGSLRVHTEMSPVLAQTYTQPFVVFSAKRFPGVPDTTALSIALGNQGQKLPLRNRNGTSKQGRKRQRDGSDGSGDESD